MSDKQISKSVGMQILRKRTEKNYTRETLATLADVSPSLDRKSTRLNSSHM